MNGFLAAALSAINEVVIAAYLRDVQCHTRKESHR